MVLSLLSSFTLMIRRQICSLSLLIANGLNSYAKTLVWSPSIFSFSFLMHLHLVFILCFVLHVFVFVFVYAFVFVFFVFFFFFQFCFILFFIKKNWKKKYKNSVCFVYIDTCVSWIAIETKFYKFCISCKLDEHLYAQLSKWALWLLFVMSKIKLSLVLNTHINLFEGKD